MWEGVERRCADLARRAGLVGVSPAVVAAALALLGLVVVAAMWRWWPRAEQEGFSAGGARGDAAPVATRSSEDTGSAKQGAAQGEGGKPAAGDTVMVHVVGAVVHPGVYELPAAARVCDAVGAAGGLTGNAAQGAINLARPLVDGEQIAFPTADEFRAAAAGASAQGGQTSGGGAGSGTSPGKNAAQPSGTPVNINTADAAALDALPGVGPSTAAKIVAERETNGPFESPDDLGRVTGIGPKKLEQLRELVCVR